MVRNIFILVIVLAVFAPTIASAEEEGLIPAICQQILDPEENKSVPQIIVDRFKGIPSSVVKKVDASIDAATESLAESVESYKGSDTTSVLGASVSKFADPALGKGLDAIAFLLRHWMWTTAGLALITLGWFMRF